MPKRGKTKWADLMYQTLLGLGGESHLNQIYERLFELPEAKEKIAIAKGSAEKIVDMKAEVRCLIQRDSRFAKVPGMRGRWRIKHAGEETKPTPVPTKEKYSLPARYAERSVKMLRLMKANAFKTQTGWAQREIAKELSIDINAVNKLVNFMIMEEILFLKGGSGKTYDPFVYAPREGVLEQFA